MDEPRFDTLTRSVTGETSRRSVLSRLSAAALAAASLHRTGTVGARKRKRKLKTNAFGCVDVGKGCLGKNGTCCSGICQGKKPKPGRKDRSQCVAHDASTCQAGDNGEICGAIAQVSCTSTSNDPGICHTTTGNAGYCPSVVQCAACKRDRDCQSIYGSGAACLVCGGCAEGTLCAGLGAM